MEGMMNRSKIISMTVAVASLLVLMTCATTDADRTPAAAFDGYQNWTMVNMATIAGDATGVLGSAHEGAAGFREVYVNEIGRSVALEEADYPFPEGTVVLKEAYRADGSGNKGALSNLTIMVKRESEYDPENGDWEYIMTTSTGAVQAQGKLQMCIGCHWAASDTDFVFTRR